MITPKQELKQKVIDFLKTYDLNPKEISSNAILFSRFYGSDDNELIYFYEKSERDELNLQELDIELKGIINKEEISKRTFLSNKPLGIVPEPVSKNGFKYQLPVQFFDREFTYKENSPLKKIEEEVKKYEEERIPQPYEKSKILHEFKIGDSVESKIIPDGNITDGLNERELKEDILDELISDLEEAKQSRIRIIIAPAGYGKTVLMSNLYLKLLNKFNKSKSKQILGVRPLMMLPGHIERAESLASLINNFINKEYTFGSASDRTFKFWIQQGFAYWLLDGLEELILKIPNPEEFLLELIDEYLGNKSQIVISIRQPLLASTPSLKEIIEEWRKGYGITTYDLTDWGEKQINLYFNKNLSTSSDEKDIFIKDINSNNTLKELCKVPYYCNLIAELKNTNQFKYITDEVELVEYSVEKICEREYDKGLDKVIFPRHKQLELFSTLAIEGLKKENGLLPPDEFSLWVELPFTGYDERIKQEQTSCLKRHSVLFSSNIYIDFIQDIVRDYFRALGLSQELARKSLSNFGKGDLEVGNFIWKYLVKKSEAHNWNELLNMLWQFDSSPQSPSRIFRNILKIFLGSNFLEKEKRLRDVLNNKNLSGLIFKDLELSKVNFSTSNLTNVQFISCNLSEANFDRCYFKGTLISNDSNLQGATTRESILESIIFGKKEITSTNEIKKFFYNKTKIIIEAEQEGPCQAALNFKKIIEKFVRKRIGYGIRKKFVSIGVSDGDNIIEKAIKNDYIFEDGDFLKIKINRFDEIEKYNLFFTQTDGIKRLLDSICDNTNIGCKHVPTK